MAAWRGSAAAGQPRAAPSGKRSHRALDTRPKRHVPRVNSTHGTSIASMAITRQSIGAEQIKETAPSKVESSVALCFV